MNGYFSPINQWIRINLRMNTLKKVSLGLCVVVVVQSFSLVRIAFRDPVVIVNSESGHGFYVGKYESLKLNDILVEKFVTSFITARFEWAEFNAKKISSQIQPLVTPGFLKKTNEALLKSSAGDFKEKEVSQSVVNIRPIISKDKVVAEFDRILKINGIALPIPTQASFQIEKGDKNFWNPMGLYVNGIIIHEEK